MTQLVSCIGILGILIIWAAPKGLRPRRPPCDCILPVIGYANLPNPSVLDARHGAAVHCRARHCDAVHSSASQCIARLCKHPFSPALRHGSIRFSRSTILRWLVSRARDANQPRMAVPRTLPFWVGWRPVVHGTPTNAEWQSARNE